MLQNDSPTMVAASPLLLACANDRTKTFSLIDMVPDFEKITIDEDDIDGETTAMLNSCAFPSCPNIEAEEKSLHDPTNSANRRPSGRRAGHPLKSSLKSTASTVATSMMDESSTSTILNVSQSSTRRRGVSFTNLEIRSYGVTLGNVATLNGPPVTLDWDYDPAETETYDVDAYEYHRYERRTKSELVIPPSHREYLLMQSGFSRSEIKLAMEEAKQEAKEREKTVRACKRSRRVSFDQMWGKAKLLSLKRTLRRNSADI